MKDIEKRKLKASLNAATCIYTARKEADILPIWPSSLEELTTYKSPDLENLSAELLDSIKNKKNEHETQKD